MVVVQSDRGGTEWVQITRTYSVTTIFGDRAAGGGSRINKEKEKNVDTGSTYQHARLSSRFIEYSLDKQRGRAWTLGRNY